MWTVYVKKKILFEILSVSLQNKTHNLALPSFFFLIILYLKVVSAEITIESTISSLFSPALSSPMLSISTD